MFSLIQEEKNKKSAKPETWAGGKTAYPVPQFNTKIMLCHGLKCFLDHFWWMPLSKVIFSISCIPWELNPQPSLVSDMLSYRKAKQPLSNVCSLGDCTEGDSYRWIVCDAWKTDRTLTIFNTSMFFSLFYLGRWCIEWRSAWGKTLMASLFCSIKLRRSFKKYYMGVVFFFKRELSLECIHTTDDRKCSVHKNRTKD